MQAAAEGFNADHGLFTATPDGLAYPQPAAVQVPNGLPLLRFLGAIFGKVCTLCLPTHMQHTKVLFNAPNPLAQHALCPCWASLQALCCHLKRQALWFERLLSNCQESGDGIMPSCVPCAGPVRWLAAGLSTCPHLRAYTARLQATL